MPVTALQLRHYGAMCFELAAEMEVDGADRALIDRVHANGATCFIEAVKADRKVEAVVKFWGGGGARDIEILPTVTVESLDWPYRAEGEIINGVETLTGRWACCGAQADLASDPGAYGPHADYCPRLPGNRGSWVIAEAQLRDAAQPNKVGDSESLRTNAYAVRLGDL